MESTQMSDELYQFLACDYSATGEGRTLCLLITRAYPIGSDYATESYFDNGNFVLGTLGNTAKFRAAREFIEEFGGYYAQGAENLSREEFLKRFGNHLPPYTEKILSPEPGEGPGNFNLKLQIHMNFS
jgi:hypothetical protein